MGLRTSMIATIILIIIVQVAIQTEQQERYLLPAEATQVVTGGFGPRILTIATLLPMWFPLGTAMVTIAVTPMTQGFA